jgi:hypothetical protein
MLDPIGLEPFWRIRKELVSAAVESAHHHTRHPNSRQWIIEIRGLDCKLLIID